MSVNVWSNVQVSAETALGPAKAITAVSVANPGIVTAAGHGFQPGDWVRLSLSGMRLLDQAAVKVGPVTTDTFTLLGIDTTGMGLTATGTARKITFGAPANTFQSVSASGGESSDITITTIHDSKEKTIPGLDSAVVYSFDSLWDPTDPCLIVLKAAARLKASKAMLVTFATQDQVAFVAIPAASMLPTGSSQQVVTTPVSFRLQGELNFYAAS